MTKLNRNSSILSVKKMKVYYGSYPRNGYARHPVIRLSGKYLNTLCGFKIGDVVEVRLSRGSIKISAVKIL